MRRLIALLLLLGLGSVKAPAEEPKEANNGEQQQQQEPAPQAADVKDPAEVEPVKDEEEADLDDKVAGKDSVEESAPPSATDVAAAEKSSKSPAWGEAAGEAKKEVAKAEKRSGPYPR